ncbi:MAG: heme exporter protein [Acidobacteriota bacterium]|jgi:ABC-type multidrug transport system ATPase subunit
MTSRATAADFTAITFSDVSRHFGRRRVLNKVSLRCDAGQIVALLGPNGAGKSTLLAIAATLLAPSAGEVRYGEHSGNSLGNALRGRIGVLGHDLYVYPELTAAENLAFFGSLYALPDLSARVTAALERAGLAHRDDPVGRFSRGMRQRLALERALLHEPRLVLLDEPFTGLDDAATDALRGRLRGLRESGCIVVLTTHDLETIEGLVDRAVILQRATLSAVEPGSGSLRARYRAACAAGE